ncbi:MAG: Gfo/Idh/MocA family protein [Acidimicrobiia bacterium]
MPLVPGQPVRVALIGAGLMGALHARVIRQSRDADLACIVDPDAKVATPLAERFDTRWVPKLDDFGPFDAVVVATPTATHRAWADAALDAGKPVLVEKPLTEDLAETETLITEARTRGVPLMCGLLERFNPAVVTALGIVEEPIHVTTVRHSPYVPRITTGVAFDLLIHDIDLVLRMTQGRLREVKAQFGYSHPKSEPDTEDVAEVSLCFDDGFLASLSASRVSQRKQRMLTIAELERLVEVDLVRQDVTVYRHVDADFLDGATSGLRQQTVIDIPAITNAREPLAAQLDYFLALVRGEADAEAELATLLEPHGVTARVLELARRGNG